MIEKLEKDKLEEEKNTLFISHKKENIESVVKELDMVNLIENQRRYDIEVMLFQYKKKLCDDQRKMDRIKVEKETMKSNLVEESKLVLLKMMNHLKEIKTLKEDINKLITQKEINKNDEEELVEAFKHRQV